MSDCVSVTFDLNQQAEKKTLTSQINLHVVTVTEKY